MPRWRSLCKRGEEPSEFYEMQAFELRFGIKTGFGPPDGSGGRKWNRCWSEVPHEWAPAIDELLAKIRAKYRVEGLGDPENEPSVQIVIDQIKVKFGGLRFYYHQRGDTGGQSVVAENEINGWVHECEERLMKDDPHYGTPY